jgi:hypothetical protein
MTCVEFMRLQLGISLVRSAQIEYLGRTLVCGEFGQGVYGFRFSAMWVESITQS